MTVSTGAAGASDGVTSTTLLRTNFCSQACSSLRQSAREQARRHRRIPSAGRHALPATSPQVPRCRADALSTRPCTLRLQQPAWQAAALRMRPLTCRSTVWALCQVPPITSSTLTIVALCISNIQNENLLRTDNPAGTPRISAESRKGQNYSRISS